jgi:hypothetical protein
LRPYKWRGVCRIIRLIFKPRRVSFLLWRLRRAGWVNHRRLIQMVCPGYWTARHSSKLDVVEHVFNIAEKLVRRLPPPWQRAKRGRRPKFSARRHAAICIIRQYFDYVLREVEGQASSFMAKTIDHSTVGKAFKRLRVNYLRLLVLLLRRKLTRIAHCEFYAVDSTGISTPRLVTRRKDLKTVREREFLKLHALVGYSRRAARSSYSRPESRGRTLAMAASLNTY